MKGTVITNDGIHLLVKLAASGKALEFSRAAVGTGRIPSGHDPQKTEDLYAYKMDGIIASCSAEGDTASIVFQLSSEGVDSGFTVTEAGIYAVDPDKGEILYSYLDMSEDPQYVYADGSTITKFIEITLNVVIGSASNVTAYLNPKALISREEFDKALDEKVDIVAADERPDIEDRKKKTFYLIVTERQESSGNADHIKVSPSMGLRLLEGR